MKFLSYRIRRSALAFVAAVVATLTVATMLVAPPKAAAQPGHCPAVVAVVARGSGQNFGIYPTSYSNQGGQASNGWESVTFRAFFRHAENRYQATHGGRSLMKDVYVMGLAPEYYPATYPDYDTPQISGTVAKQQVSALISKVVAPLARSGVAAAQQFNRSVQAGRSGTMRAIENYERRTGCKPDYILMGYSQGAMVTAEHEQELANRGQLAGAVYFGNPMTHRDDPANVGARRSAGGGVIGMLPNNSKSLAATHNRVNYCLPHDSICNMTGQTVENAIETRGGTHGRYFMQSSPWDNQVSDAFGRFVDRSR